MRLGLAAWGLRELSHEEKFALTSKLGVELLEISIAGYDNDFLQPDAGSAEIRETLRLAGKYGIDLFAACTGNDFTQEDHLAEQIRQVQQAIRIAAGIGTKVLRIFAGFSSDSRMDEDRITAMLEAMRQVQCTARQYGVTLAVETHGGVAPGNAPGTVRHFASISTRADGLKRILSTGVSLLYDPANLDAAGVSEPERLYDLFRPDIASVHLKDFAPVPGGLRPCACGDGRLNWPVLLKNLAGYTGPALIEYELPDDVEQGMQKSIDFLRSVKI